MMDYFLKAVFQIAAFLLFQTILLNLVGQSKYETYIRTFSGFLLILLLFSAIRSFLGGENLLAEVQKQVEFTTEGGDFKQQLRQAEENQKQELKQEYEKRILQEVEWYLEEERYFLAEGKVEFSENWELSELFLVVSKVWQKGGEESGFLLYDDTDGSIQIEGVDPIEPIEPVDLMESEKQPEDTEETERSKELETELENETEQSRQELARLEERLARRLGINGERIVIIWKEEGM